MFVSVTFCYGVQNLPCEFPMCSSPITYRFSSAGFQNAFCPLCPNIYTRQMLMIGMILPRKIDFDAQWLVVNYDVLSLSVALTACCARMVMLSHIPLAFLGARWDEKLERCTSLKYRSAGFSVWINLFVHVVVVWAWSLWYIPPSCTRSTGELRAVYITSNVWSTLIKPAYRSRWTIK
jgi:hypothetical protein